MLNVTLLNKADSRGRLSLREGYGGMLNVALPKGREERFAYLYDFSLRAVNQCPHLLRKIGKDRQAFLLAGEQEEIRC